MPSEKKVSTVKEVVKDIESHSVVGILNMHKLPARQLYHIKLKLKGKAKVRMIKKSLILLALEKSKKNKIKDLENVLSGSPAFLFTDSDPFQLARVLESSQSPAKAKAGDIAPMDILVPAGLTELPAGPAISDLTKAGIPAGVEGGKIAVKKDTVVVKAGEIIKKEVADAIAKLGIEPMKIGLDLVAVWDNGIIYPKDVLFVPLEKYEQDIKTANANAFNLSITIGYYTKENIGTFLSKAHGEANSLAVKAGVLTPDTVGLLLAKAHNEAEAVGEQLKLDKPKE